MAGATDVTPATLTPADAARSIVAHGAPLAPERRPLREVADLVLALDVASPIDVPPYANSAMDGYAVRGPDVVGATRERRVTLRVTDTAPTAPGTANRIFTGGPVPAGADSVVRQEDTERLPDGQIAVFDGRDAGQNVRARGQDIRAGDVVLTAGTELGAAQLGVLAAIAHATPLVHRPPRVAFLASGDEIVDLDQADEILAGRKIANSNSIALNALIRGAGGIPVDLGLARDTRESLREHLARAADADLLVTTGGVSVGERDLVRAVLTELGCEMKLWRVRMRPGAPLGFGMLSGRPWIGLPGNPVSTMVTFELFVRPLIRRLRGHALPFRRTVAVCAGAPITLGPPLRHFLRVVLTREGPGSLTARLTGPQGSGILTSMARADALLIVPEDRPAVPAGAALQALVLNDPVHVAEPPF